jgi:hypothetical protein
MSLPAAAAVGAVVPSGKTGEYAKAFIYVAIGLLVIFLAYTIVKKVFGGIDGVLEALGLKESEEDKALKAQLGGATADTNRPESPWSPAFYKTAPAGARIVTSAAADKLAKQIWDSVGSFYDDPESGLAAIKQLPSQAALSFLSDRFQSKYSRDLYNWLLLKYDTNDQKKVLIQIDAYVKSLPKF